MQCICIGIEVEELSVYQSVNEAMEKTDCGTRCGLCIPYIEEAITAASSGCIPHVSRHAPHQAPPPRRRQR